MFGGSGIISTEICKLALEKGDSVTIFNRGRRKEQINPDAKLIIGNLREESVDEIQKKIENNYDVVLDCISYNVEQLKKALEIVKYRCKQLVFISSATVYSPVENVVYSEDYPIGGCAWKYAQDKADCENYLRNRTFSCEFTIIRPYITYGETRIPYQVAPLEYYTIINRIKCHKPIMICGQNTKCTLTDSRDFAVGAYGLMLNPGAYGETVNITSEYRTTWGKVIQAVATEIGEDVNIIDVPKQYLIDHKYSARFDVDEILGDKGRDMVFDNQKIKCLVPEFTGKRTFEQSMGRTLQYFNTEKHQLINYCWDARMDKFLEGYLRSVSVPFDYKSLTIQSYGYALLDIERENYNGNRTQLSQLVFKIKRKLKSLLKK